MNLIVDFSQTPVYIHEVYNRETGDVFYLRHSYESAPDQAYLELVEWADLMRKKYSEWIRSARPGKEMRERLATPMPDELDWTFLIEEIRPQNPYFNDGGRRKKALQKRLEIKVPLFSDELYEREMADNEDYLSGNSDIDQIKAEARENYTEEYWEARFWADLEARP